MLQLPAVQTYLAQKAAGWLSDKIGAKVEIKGVNIQFFDTVILEGVYIEDKKKDTLLYAGRLYAGISDYSTSDSWVKLSKITLSNARIGLRKYKDESGLNFQFIVDAFKSKNKSTTNSKPFSLSCSELSLVNNKFSYTIVGSKPPEWGFNARDIVASHINADFTDLHMHGDTIDANMKSMSAFEKSGLKLLSMNCKFRLSGKEMMFDELALKSNSTTVNGSVQFTYNNFRAFGYPFDSVGVNFNIKKADIEMGDIAYFSPFLKGINLKARLSGKITGRLNKLKCKNLELIYGSKTRFFGDVTIKDLSNTKELFIDAKVKSLVTNANDIATITIPPYTTVNKIELPAEVYRLGQISFNGSYTGFFTSFVAEGVFNTALGSVATDLQLAQIEGSTDMAYDGHVSTTNFKLGELLPDQGLGALSVNVSVDGRGFDLKTVNTGVKGHITALDFNEYRYSDIDVDGQLVKTEFTGRVQSNDPNMQLAFNGVMNFSKDVPVYNFEAEVVRIDLTALHLIKKDSSLVITAKLSSNITGNKLETLNGNIEATDVQMQYGTTVYDVGTVKLYSDVATLPKQIRLDSDIADVNIIGNYKLETLAHSLMGTINSFLPSYLVDKSKVVALEKNQDFSFTALLKNTEPITAVFVPGLLVEPGASFRGTYKSEIDELTLTGTLPKVNFKKIPFSGIGISSRTQNRTLYFATTIDRIEPADSIFFDNVSITSFTHNDSLVADIDFENKVDSIINTGSITGIARFYDKDKITINLPKLDIDAYTYRWRANPDNEITFDGDRLNITKLVIETPTESFRAFGSVSPNPDDQLNVILTKFNLANINRFIPDNIIQLAGNLNGSFSVSNLFGEPLFRSTMRVVDLSINNTYLGTGNILSNWDKDNKLINVNALILKYDTVKSVSIGGKIFPNRKNDNLDLLVQVNKLDLRSINPYLKGNVSFSRGDCNAYFTVKGDQKNPKLEGNIALRRTIATIDYLGTTYNFVDTIQVHENKILVNNLILHDNNDDKNIATVSGEVTHKGFADWKYNLNIKAKNFLCLNTNETQNSLYYGQAYVTGLINIKGDEKRSVITADVKTNPKTKFNIPLSSPNSASSNDFIVFIDNSPKKLKVPKKVSQSIGIVLDLDLEVTPDADVQIIFDKQVGDIIKGRGAGNLKMNIDTKGDFKMFGEYVIESGEYLFTLKNLLNKKFVVEKGGTINWSGDVYKANVDLTAIYSLRAAFEPIMRQYFDGVELEPYKKRMPVQCRLTMTKDLLTPDLNFGIATTTTDYSARTALASIQTSPEELNKQIFALLILNQFLPPSQVTNSASASGYGSSVSNNGYELLSSQLSSFLSQISDQFDINVNFVPGVNGGPPQVVVGGGFRIGDRVSVEASVGNTSSATSSSSTSSTGNTTGTGNTNNSQAANTIVSDFNMDIKISNDGRLRGKVFNRSNQNNILTNDIPYTQGAGVSYRREFNSFRDLFRRKRVVVPPPAPVDTTGSKNPPTPPVDIQNQPLSPGP